MPKKRTCRELRVVFDTNTLHTQVPSDLVSAETRELIQANSAHPDLKVAWHLPEVVILERHYQMRTRAEQLLRSFQRMDAILGIGINLGPEQLAPRIDTVIEAQMRQMNLTRLSLNSTVVDWNRIIRDASLRVPPFQAGETEKGFRDAMILETFIQLVEASPRTPNTCRLVFVTKDELLTTAAAARVTQYANSEVIGGLEELRNLINTLISSADEAFVKELREKATKLFFVPKDQETFYFREKVGDQIREKFSHQLAELPPGATKRDTDTIAIGFPRFVKKEGQRVHWVTPITYKINTFKFVEASQPTAVGTSSPTSGLTSTYPSILGGLAFLGSSSSTAGLLGVPSMERVPVKNGRTEFNVAWSATVASNRRLIRPHIDDISFVATTWE